MKERRMPIVFSIDGKSTGVFLQSNSHLQWKQICSIDSSFVSSIRVVFLCRLKIIRCPAEIRWTRCLSDFPLSMFLFDSFRFHQICYSNAYQSEIVSLLRTEMTIFIQNWSPEVLKWMIFFSLVFYILECCRSRGNWNLYRCGNHGGQSIVYSPCERYIASLKVNSNNETSKFQ